MASEYTASYSEAHRDQPKAIRACAPSVVAPRDGLFRVAEGAALCTGARFASSSRTRYPCVLGAHTNGSRWLARDHSN